MRIGVSFPKDVSIARQRQVARLCEEAGIASLWANDAFGRDPFLVCQAWAEETERLEVGIGVLQILTRSPVQVAKAAATLQEASAGRFRLGLGVSQRQAMRWHGVEIGPPLDTARDAIEIVRAVAAGAETDHRGAVLSSHGFRLGITPLPPPPPIYLGAMRPRMLALAGEKADGVLLSWESAAAIERQAELVRDAARAAGRPAPEIAAYVRIAIGADGEAARRALASEIGFYWSMYGKHFLAQELGPSARAAAEAFARGGEEAAAAALDDDVLLKLGWCGTPADDLGPVLAEYAAAGVEHLIARVVPVGDAFESLRAVLASLERARA